MLGTTNTTVLIVDDTEANRQLLSVYFRGHKYQVLEAASGTEALDVLTTHHVDLVVLDILMPGLDGIEVLHRMRDDPHLAAMPVIMCSAIAESQYTSESTNLPLTRYVTKPVNFALLGTHVHTLLDG